MSSADYLTSQQMLSILQVAQNEYGTREHCMFLLAAMHGLRSSEISKLTVADVQDVVCSFSRAARAPQCRDAKSIGYLRPSPSAPGYRVACAILTSANTFLHPR
jgi:hypothetical protein